MDRRQGQGRGGAGTVAVVGGGLGGLTAALALLRAGFDVHVYEQASALSEIGAGVQVSPNASRVLHGLGPRGGARTHRRPAARLAPAALGRRPHAAAHAARRAARGRPSASRTTRSTAPTCSPRWPAPCPPSGCTWATASTAFEDRGDRVELRFAGGARAEADVLVAADGIHSPVRRALFGPEQPRFTGCIAYRGLVPAERLRHLGLEVTAQVWMGPGRHFVHYFVSGGRLVNFVAVVEQDTWTRESWTDRGEVADALAAFDGWHPQVRTILGAVDETFVWALFDRTPLERWSAGRVDAARRRLPRDGPVHGPGRGHGHRGRRDARRLPRRRRSDPAGALRRYEALRAPRAGRLQAMSTTNKTRFHLPDGPEQAARDAEMAAGATDWSFKAVAWIYEHDAAAAGARRRRLRAG